MDHAMITPLLATILGLIEGLTEYLPISSTGHLIVASKALKLDLADPGVDAYLIVIQAGAILAVLGYYRHNVMLMLRGLAGRDSEGLRLFALLTISFLPAAATGFLFNHWIKRTLFGPWPVAAALAVGGLLMILVERLPGVIARRNAAESDEPRQGGRVLNIADVTVRMAILIGLGQCLALWPGTSRSMATIVSAMLVGLRPRAAAEYSFLLALPTLGAATAYDLLKHHREILHASGPLELGIGFVISCVVAWASIAFLLRYLNKHGFMVFGAYRIALAVAVAAFLF